jgi:hypothetical protein
MSTMSSRPVHNTISWPTTPSRLPPKFACGHLQLRFHTSPTIAVADNGCPFRSSLSPNLVTCFNTNTSSLLRHTFQEGRHAQMAAEDATRELKTVQTEARCASKELCSDRQVKLWYSHLKSSVVILPSSLHTYASSTVPVGYDAVPQVNLPALHTHAAIQHFRIHNASQYLTTHFAMLLAQPNQ